MTNIIVGALLGALVTFVFSEVRQARQRVSEKSGLARLLLAEIEHNSPDRASPTVIVGKRIVQAYVAHPPKLEAWKETRVRLAQLLDPEDFVALTNYYQIVQKLTDDATPISVFRKQVGPAKAGPEVQVRSHRLSPEEPSWNERTEDLQSRLRRYANPPRRLRLIGF
jgi:hypothetical protein